MYPEACLEYREISKRENTGGHVASFHWDLENKKNKNKKRQRYIGAVDNEPVWK